MSSVKCIGTIATLGAVAMGGTTLHKGLKVRKETIAQAQEVADKFNGKIPAGGARNGILWDGFTTVDEIKKASNKAVATTTCLSAALGAVTAGVISGLTLLAKAKIK